MKRSRFSELGGFTLIELLVVIAIISLLASMAVSALSSARAKSRDAKRISDMRQMRVALDLYYDRNLSFPTVVSYGENVTTSGCSGGWDCSHVDQDGASDGDFMEFLEAGGYMDRLPDDPTNDDDHHYKFAYFTGSGESNGCTLPYYVLVAYGLEGNNYTDDSSACFTANGWADSDGVYVIVGGQN